MRCLYPVDVVDIIVHNHTEPAIMLAHFQLQYQRVVINEVYGLNRIPSMLTLRLLINVDEWVNGPSFPILMQRMINLSKDENRQEMGGWSLMLQAQDSLCVI